MSQRGRNTLSDDRGVSEQVAVVLLVGMVLTGATIVLLTGGQALSDVEDHIRSESGEKSLREIDSKLSSLAFEDNSTVHLDVGEKQVDDVDIVRSGHVNVTVNRRGSCSANISMSSIRYETTNGDTLAYEMGGIWLKTDDGARAQSPPDLQFNNGTMSMTVYNITGTLQDGDERATKLVEPSKNRTAWVNSRLYGGDCSRPDNVTVVVQSDFYEAWHQYLQSEMASGTVTKYPGNRSVRVHLTQSDLPQATDDSTNQVVDLNGSSYVNVTLDDNAVNVTKNASVEYTVTVTPLAQGTRSSSVRSFDAEVVYREPIDVVFVVDESGSMDPGPPSDPSKRTEAQDAMQLFLGFLNESRDRAGMVGFNLTGRYSRTNGRYLARSFSAINATIGDTIGDGATNTAAGMNKSSRILDLVSNGSRKQVVILLSDGRNNFPGYGDADEVREANRQTIERAREIKEKGGTVYTIGFGARSGLNETLLDLTAVSGGGEYHYASNASELQKVFEDIADSVTETRSVVKHPVSLNVSTGTATFYPQITGDTDHLANATGVNNSSVLNVNDPAAPGDYAFTFTVEDGTNMSLNALSYDCEQWELSDEMITNSSTNETYNVVRCAEMNESSLEVVPPSNVSIYRDGANVSHLVEDDGNWWQADLKNETLLPYLENGTETLDLPSNQAIVVFNYTTSGGVKSRILVRLSIGNSEASSTARSVVHISVNEIRVGEDD